MTHVLHKYVLSVAPAATIFPHSFLGNDCRHTLSFSLLGGKKSFSLQRAQKSYFDLEA